MTKSGRWVSAPGPCCPQRLEANATLPARRQSQEGPPRTQGGPAESRARERAPPGAGNGETAAAARMAAAEARARECGEPGQGGRQALYFCGSIRGGREDWALYERIVSRLRRFGAVLTEHVAAKELSARGEARGGTRAAGPGARAAGERVGPASLPRLHSARRRPSDHRPAARPYGPEPSLLPSGEGEPRFGPRGSRELAGGSSVSAFICYLDLDSFLENFTRD